MMNAKAVRTLSKSKGKSGNNRPHADAHELTYEEQLIVSLRRIIRAADIHSHLLQREFGVTGPQLATLRVIRRLQPVSAGALANATQMGFATMSGILDRLVTRRYISRTRDPNDRRSVILKLTRPGERLLESAPSLLQSKFRGGVRRMNSAERTTLLQTLELVAELMHTDIPDEDEATA
jgi:DNA-binding MarR family transcriptional regulator